MYLKVLHLMACLLVILLTLLQKQWEKKRGRPSLRNESGLGSEDQVVTERLRTKFLKNQATANDIVEDAVGIWTAGVSAGSLHGASV